MRNTRFNSYVYVYLIRTVKFTIPTQSIINNKKQIPKYINCATMHSNLYYSNGRNKLMRERSTFGLESCPVNRIYSKSKVIATIDMISE